MPTTNSLQTRRRPASNARYASIGFMREDLERFERLRNMLTRQWNTSVPPSRSEVVTLALEALEEKLK